MEDRGQESFRFDDVIRRAAAWCGVLALVFVAGCATCEPRPNLGLYRSQLIEWHDSGGYEKCFAEAAAKTEGGLKAAIALQKAGGKPAIVLDIDETSLSNWPYMVNVGFDIKDETFTAWTATGDGIPLKPILSLYQRATAAGVAVFFITGRAEVLRANTEKELRNAGFAKWEELYLRPPGYRERSMISYKSGARKAIEGRGYRIVLNVGDQFSDLEGGYAERAVKLPNPFYFVP